MLAAPKAAGSEKPEAYSLEYVEDFFEPRTTQMLADRSPQQNGIARTGSYRREKLLYTLSSRIWASRSLSSGLIEVIFVPNLGERTWTTCKPQVNVLPCSSSITS